MTVTDERTAVGRLDVPVCRAISGNTETRAVDGSMPHLAGHFSVFGNWYEIDSWFEGNFLERIAPGAFKKTFKESGDRIRVLLEHGFDPTVGDKPLGVPESLSEDATGAAYDVQLFDATYVRDLVPAFESGVYGSSFRFKVLKDEWDEEPGASDHNPTGIPERTITEVRVFEFGPTVFPANPAATAGLRSTTDQYYEQLRRRSPDQYDEVVRSLPHLRPPEKATSAAEVTPAAPSTGAAERTVPAEPARAPSTTDEPRKHSEASVNTNETRRTLVNDDRLTVEERTARQSEIRSRLSEIDTEHSGAVLPEDIQNEWDALRTEFDDHERAIEAQKRREDELRTIVDEPGRAERGTDPGQRSTGTRRPENIYDLASYRQQARSVDELPQLYRDGAMRAVEQARFPGVKRREDAQEQVERLLDTVDDENATLARKILVTGSPLYQRAFGKYATALSTNGLTSEEQRALAVGAGATGGFAVPFQLDPTVILTNAGSTNPLRQISRVEQIVGKEWQGITSTGVTVSRVEEATEADDNSPTLAQPAVKAERVQGFIPYSIEVDQDWGALQAEMTKMLGDAKANEEATSFVTGDGVSPNAGGIIGTLNAGQNVTPHDTVTTGALYALEDALPDRWLDNASFLAHRSIYNLVRQLANGSDGADLWVRLGEGRPPELLGYPAYRTSAMAPLGVGARYLLLGDFSQFLIVDRIGMMVDVVPHLFGANRRPTGQRGLYTIWRNNSKILVQSAFRVLHKAA